MYKDQILTAYCLDTVAPYIGLTAGTGYRFKNMQTSRLTVHFKENSIYCYKTMGSCLASDQKLLYI